MQIIDHYPETLRDIHDKILDVITLPGREAAAAAIAVHVTEWIRRRWSARTLSRKWWGPLSGLVDQEQSGTLIEVAADPVCTLRGRELRAAVWSILAGSRSLWTSGWSDICRLATVITVTVESNWSCSIIYIPSGKEVDRAIRDALVWQAFNGLSSIDGVIAQFGLSQRQIYDIYRRVQDERDLREQPSLPLF